MIAALLSYLILLPLLHLYCILYVITIRYRCGHCKALKPDWDKLMSEFNDSATQLIADVDCTADGEELCNEQGMLKTVDSIICSVILSYGG